MQLPVIPYGYHRSLPIDIGNVNKPRREEMMTTVSALLLAISCICNAIVGIRHSKRLEDIEQRLRQLEQREAHIPR